VSTVVRRSCIIATTPRTGSWLLAEAMLETGLAGEPQEYFGWEGFRAWSKEFGLAKKAPHLRFVKKALAHGTTPNGIFSAKMHWSQLERFVKRVRASPGSWPESSGAILLHFFPDLHFVHLSRADTARQAISYWKASQGNEWWDVGAPGEPPDVKLDYQQIRWCEDILMSHDRDWQELFEELKIPTFEVTYEDFEHDRVPVVEKILDFLEVPHGPIELPPSRLRRQADDQTEEWLDNYRRVRESLPHLPEKWKWTGTAVVPDADAQAEPA
jgi:LPS sulfotransferase NodH